MKLGMNISCTEANRPICYNGLFISLPYQESGQLFKLTELKNLPPRLTFTTPGVEFIYEAT